MAKRTSSGFITMGEVGKLAAGIGVLIGAVVIALTFLGTKVDWPEVGLYATVFGAVLAAGVVLLAGWRWWTERRARGEAIEQGARFIEATGKAQAPPRELSPKHRQHWEALETKFKNILPKLGPEKLGKTPIFLVLGETSGGKSLAIHKSGIRWHPDFKPPQIQADSEQAGQGAGGTLGMEWWFGENEIIIDTAGELLESDEVSNVAWGKFIDNLRQHRKAPQFSGVMVFIPAGRLYDTKEGREESALRLRSRLRALRDAYGLRFPVWIVISKADLVPGFTSFVRHLDMVDADKQLFGWTNADTDFDKAFEPAQIRGELRKMAERMRKLRRKMIGLKKRDGNAYGPADGADDLFRFPGELEKLAEPLEAYLADLFMKDGYAKNDSRTASRELRVPFVRGVYLTSAVQTGEVLDQELAAAMGLKVEDIKRVPPPDRKPYFVNRVFERMLIEKGLATVHISVRLARLRRLALWSGVMGVLAIVFIAVAFYMNDQLNGAVKTPLARWTDRSDGRHWKWTSPAQATQWGKHWSESEVLATWVGEAAGATKDGKVPWVFLPVALGERDVLGTRRKEVARLVLEQHFVKPLLQLNEDALELRKPNPLPLPSNWWDLKRMSALRGLWRHAGSSDEKKKYIVALEAVAVEANSNPSPDLDNPLRDLWGGAFGFDPDASHPPGGVAWRPGRVNDKLVAKFEVDDKPPVDTRQDDFVRTQTKTKSGDPLPPLLAAFNLSGPQEGTMTVGDLVKAASHFGGSSTTNSAGEPEWWSTLAKRTSKEYREFATFAKVVGTTRTTVSSRDGNNPQPEPPGDLEAVKAAFVVHTWVKERQNKISNGESDVSYQIFTLKVPEKDKVTPKLLVERFNDVSKLLGDIEKALGSPLDPSEATSPGLAAKASTSPVPPTASGAGKTEQWMKRLKDAVAAGDGHGSGDQKKETVDQVLLSGLRRYFEENVKPEVRRRQLKLSLFFFENLKLEHFVKDSSKPSSDSVLTWANKLERWDQQALKDLISSIDAFNHLAPEFSQVLIGASGATNGSGAPAGVALDEAVQKKFVTFVVEQLAPELERDIKNDRQLVTWKEKPSIEDLKKVGSGKDILAVVRQTEPRIRDFSDLHGKLTTTKPREASRDDARSMDTGKGIPPGRDIVRLVSPVTKEAGQSDQPPVAQTGFDASEWDDVKRQLYNPCGGGRPTGGDQAGNTKTRHPLLEQFAQKVNEAGSKACIANGEKIAKELASNYSQPLVSDAASVHVDWASLHQKAEQLVVDKPAVEAWLQSLKGTEANNESANKARAALSVAEHVLRCNRNPPSYKVTITPKLWEGWSGQEVNGSKSRCVAGATLVELENATVAGSKVTLRLFDVDAPSSKGSTWTSMWFMFEAGKLKDQGEISIVAGDGKEATLKFEKLPRFADVHSRPARP